MFQKLMGFMADRNILFKRTPAKPDTVQKRNAIYAGTKNGDIYGSWLGTNYTSNAELFSSLSKLRGRSRELMRNNDYGKRIFNMIKRNVIGDTGFKLQMNIMAGKNSIEPDTNANKEIESAWRRWSKKGICDVTGNYSFVDVQNLAIGHTSMDGEVLARLVEGADNSFGFALQMMEADHLDERYSVQMTNGNMIKLAVEMTPFGKPVAYHIFRHHPGDSFHSGMYGRNDRVIIPAAEMIHLYKAERISQNRGVPWIHAAMTRLNMLGGYEEAELIAARMGANVHGIWSQVKNEDGEYTGDSTGGDGTITMESEPGIDRVAPEGMQYDLVDPTHPNAQFKDFVKSILRGIASGMDVTYNYLANDYEGVNYSSLRGAEMETRDAWHGLQNFFSESFLHEIFPIWLKNAMLRKEVNLPMSKFDMYNKPRFVARGFRWVDPKSEMAANMMKLAMGLTSPSILAGETSSLDYEDLQVIIKTDREMRNQHGNTSMDDAKLAELLAKVDEILEKAKEQKGE